MMVNIVSINKRNSTISAQIYNTTIVILARTKKQEQKHLQLFIYFSKNSIHTDDGYPYKQIAIKKKQN